MAAPSHPRSRFRWLIYAAVTLIIAAAVWHFAFRKPAFKPRFVNPDWAGQGWPGNIPVRTVAAKSEDLPVRLKAIGTVTPLNAVTVKSRVEAILLRITFEEGQQVEKGQLLAELDPASFKIQVAQAEGVQRQVQARLKSAKSDLERIQELHSRNLVSNQELDLQLALVAEREGAAASAQADLDNARLRLSYTRIEAPITGRVGLRRVDPGNLVREGDANGICVITQTTPISVTFTIPETELQSVMDATREGEPLLVEAWDRTETKVLASGSLKTFDNQIDLATGTLRLKAEFSNEDDRLFPNQFVNVRLRVRTLQNATVIPAAAVQFGARGTYVYVITPENKATIRDVVLGPVEGSMQSVSKGINVGDQVVLEGLDRLREGSTVVVANEPPPTPVTTAK